MTLLVAVGLDLMSFEGHFQPKLFRHSIILSVLGFLLHLKCWKYFSESGLKLSVLPMKQGLQPSIRRVKLGQDSSQISRHLAVCILHTSHIQGTKV